MPRVEPEELGVGAQERSRVTGRQLGEALSLERVEIAAADPRLLLDVGKLEPPRLARGAQAASEIEHASRLLLQLERPFLLVAARFVLREPPLKAAAGEDADQPARLGHGEAL